MSLVIGFGWKVQDSAFGTVIANPEKPLADFC